MTQQEYNEGIETLWDLIDVLNALNRQWPGYFNDPVDTDKEECFVRDADTCRYDAEEYTDCAKMAGLMVCPVA